MAGIGPRQVFDSVVRSCLVYNSCQFAQVGQCEGLKVSGLQLKLKPLRLRRMAVAIFVLEFKRNTKVAEKFIQK